VRLREFYIRSALTARQGEGNMDQRVQQEDSSPALDFIKDEAIAQDEFRSHTRIATAIATVIRTRADLKVVGLLGPWGAANRLF
jgi:hypothetical protein